MNPQAHIYYSIEEAAKVAGTMSKLGLGFELVGSAVLATRDDFKMLMEQTNAPDPIVIAEVK